jgi:hypothetical protein
MSTARTEPFTNPVAPTTSTAWIAEIRPWADPVLDQRGYDPRDRYVETFWLGVIGPTATWIMRGFADRLERFPDGFSVDLDTMAAAIGVSCARGQQSPFGRALHRCVMFGLARTSTAPQRVASQVTRAAPTTTLEVRRRVPQVPTRSLRRLPPELFESHDQWVRARYHPGHQPADHVATIASEAAPAPPIGFSAAISDGTR